MRARTPTPDKITNYVLASRIRDTIPSSTAFFIVSLEKMAKRAPTSLFLLLVFMALSATTFSSYARPQVAKSTVQVILEISDYGAGMVNYQGHKLFCRLYTDGRLEYEVLPEFDPDAARPNFVLLKKQTWLSKDDVAKIRNLTEQPDFLQARDKYRQLHSHIDAVFVKTIIYRNHNIEKRIQIRNYAPTDSRAASYYPVSLMKLLQRISELRPKDE